MSATEENQDKTPEECAAEQAKVREAVKKDLKERQHALRLALDEAKSSLLGEGETNLATLVSSQEQLKKMEEMLEKMAAMNTELESKLVIVRTEAARRNIDVEKLLGGVDKVTAKEMALIRVMEEDLKKKINKVLPPDMCLGVEAEQKSKEVLTKERKGKTRGARNKWLPMR
jgi:hypothetical protein